MINPYILLALFVSFVLTNGYAYHTVGNPVVKNIYIKVLDKANENIEKNPNYAECALDADGLRLFNTRAATETTNTRKSVN